VNVNFTPLGFLVKPQKRFFGSSMVWIETSSKVVCGASTFSPGQSITVFPWQQVWIDVEDGKLL